MTSWDGFSRFHSFFFDYEYFDERAVTQAAQVCGAGGDVLPGEVHGEGAAEKYVIHIRKKFSIEILYYIKYNIYYSRGSYEK